MPSIILSDNGVSSGSAGLKSTAASDGALALQTTTSGGAATTAVTIDTSQNMGLGVTPSASWNTTFASSTICFKNSGVINGSLTGNGLRIGTNWYYSAGGSDTYLTTAAASRFDINGNTFAWQQAASGTAGNPITFTQAMTLDASGNLGVGTTSPADRLHVSGGGIRVTNGNVAVTDGTTSFQMGVNNFATGYGMGTTSSTPLIFASNGAERARIDSSGNFGIGTTSPNSRFEVRFTSNDYGYFSNTGDFNTGVRIQNTGRSYGIFVDGGAGSSNGLRFYDFTASADRMRIDSSGNLLVGTASGSFHTLQKDNAGNVAAAVVNSNNSTPYGMNIQFSAAAPNDATRAFLTAYDTGATRAQIRSNGGLANFSANNVNLSDERTKTDIQDAGGYLAKICAIPVRTFKYKDQTDDELNLGVIAQEVEVVAPELVDVSGFGETPEDGVPLKAIYQTDLQYALMKSIQELKAELDTAKAEIAALKGTQP